MIYGNLPDTKIHLNPSEPERIRDIAFIWFILMCRFRIKGRFFNISIFNVHRTHSEDEGDDRYAFYEQLGLTYNSCLKHDVKIVIGDFNAQVDQKGGFRQVIGRNWVVPTKYASFRTEPAHALSRKSRCASISHARTNVR